MRRGSSARAFVLLVLLLAGSVFSAALCNSYEAKASKVVNDGQERVKEIVADAEADTNACAAGSLEACDRAMQSMSAIADEVEQLHRELSELKPSGKARQWHADYLLLLEKMQWTMRSAVAAWEAGDFQAILAATGAFSELEGEEVRLTNYFNNNLR